MSDDEVKRAQRAHIETLKAAINAAYAFIKGYRAAGYEFPVASASHAEYRRKTRRRNRRRR